MIEVLAVGTNTQMEGWQWFYLFLITLSAMLLCLPITKDWLKYSHKPPFWLIAIAGIDIFVWCTPYGWAVVFALHMEFIASSAPITAKIIVFLFSLSAFSLAMINFFPLTRRQ